MTAPTLKEARDEKKEAVNIALAKVVELLEGSSWDMLALNERTQQPVWKSPPPCNIAATEFPAPLRDTDAVSIVVSLREQGYLVSKTNAFDAALNVAARRLFDPVADYLRGLEWDGKHRIKHWLRDYFGATAEHTDLARWHNEIGRRWFISAVARALRPGCKVDTMLIAEGPQGARKSSAFRALVPDAAWFADNPPPLNNPREYTSFLLGPWIVEMDELEQFNKRDVETVKGFLSKQVDRVTLKYKRLAEDFPRRVVVCGTTNDQEYLLDGTGGRRFWSFKVGEIDVDAITRDRDQLWAEAVHEFNTGEAWWIDNPELLVISNEEQEQRYSASVYEQPIVEWLDANPKREHVTTNDALLEALGMDPLRIEQKHQRQAAKVLHRLGWEKKRVRTGEGTDPRNGGSRRAYAYVRPTH